MEEFCRLTFLSLLFLKLYINLLTVLLFGDDSVHRYCHSKKKSVYL